MCAAFLLGVTLSHHLSQYESSVAKNINRNIYVDNLVTGARTSDEALSFYKETKVIFNNASMNMRKWICNDKQVMNEVKDEDKCLEQKIKVLGLLWDVQNDRMSVAQYKANQFQPTLTKRIIIQTIASVYDPLGTCCPILLQPKVLLQELWMKSLGWDDAVSLDVVRRWQKYEKEIQKIHLISCMI